jgi:uncharacterized membrane protein YphA (DoxX/SURF4 family)
MNHEEKTMRQTYWVLKMTYGLVPIVAGLDKFTNLLVDWSRYLSPAMLKALPVGAETFMMLVGVIEIAAGILVLSKFTRWGAWVVSAWLVCIALNLIFGGYYDIAVRDVSMAVGAFGLAQLAALLEQKRAPVARAQIRETEARA